MRGKHEESHATRAVEEMERHSDLGAAEVLCGDRNLCARPYRHDGSHESFAGNVWPTCHNYMHPDGVYCYADHG